MRVSRLSVVSVFAGLAAAAFFAGSSSAKPDDLKEIVKGVWFREGDLMKHGHCNNIIIEMKDYLIVVDANFPSGARLAMADAKKVSTKPVKWVFDTHHHGDHAYGNGVWTKAGATTLAYKGVAEEMKRYEPKRWQSSVKEREDVREMKLDTAPPPQQTFDKSPHVIDDGSRRVEFWFFGWAHTRGDGFVYLPKEQVVATGDAVVNGPYNYTADGNVGNWPDVVKKVQKLNAKHVLPAHGEAGGPEILSGQLAFMVELRKAVQSAIKSGKKLNDLVEMKGEQPVKSSLALPDSVKHWTGTFLAGQVKDTFEELTQGKPHGEISGGK
ncbi:MAG: MBL fold metallo-hydrolase [Acidobacteria bacterium]|nr:MBL fold metallo-hydrolase [Acidobacteriota bacterium]